MPLLAPKPHLRELEGCCSEFVYRIEIRLVEEEILHGWSVTSVV